MANYLLANESWPPILPCQCAPGWRKSAVANGDDWGIAKRFGRAAHTRVIRMMQLIALLGRLDEPTDAVEEYCRYLGGALRAYEVQLEMRRLSWEKYGWTEALRALRSQAAEWRGSWVMLQYTALGWSARGFPFRIFRVVRTLQSTGVRIAIVFHDAEPFPGARVIDSLRRAFQIRTMRRLVASADLAVFTVPPEKLSWRPQLGHRTDFVPVGANLPIPPGLTARAAKNSTLTIGVFSITGGEKGARETQLVIDAVRYAAERLGRLRLCVFGRHAELRERDFIHGLQGLPIELSVEGVLDPTEVVARLTACDLLFFVRGGISSRRGSAIAGIACGLPVIAFSGSETAAPITDAGVVLVPPDAPEELNTALVRVLSDAVYRNELARRSLAAGQLHFAWPVIASRFAALLRR